MRNHFPQLVVFLSAILFTFLFYHESIGLNLLLFEWLAVFYLFVFQKTKINSRIAKIFFWGTLLSSVAVIVNYTAFAIIFNLVSFFVFIGVLIYPQAQSVITSVLLGCSNIFLSIRNLFSSPAGARSNKPGARIKSFFYFSRIFLIPALIIFLFIFIYNHSSPHFKSVTDQANESIAAFFSSINFVLVMVFLLGIISSAYILLRSPDQSLINKDKISSVKLLRKKIIQKIVQGHGLKREINAAFLLLTTLNVLLLVLNILDIYHVWFNFTWNGSYLKQFVHEGTYLLIISILVSIGIVLYFFRGNINFYSKSTVIKNLAVIWMIQNCILVISVAIRNFRYIEYFALAYKRIGVLFFLALTLYGIITIIIKIRKTNSSFYLFQKNGMALYLTLLVISLFNWDNIIAKYNFSHYETAFVHYDFLSELPPKSLPYLVKTKEELMEIDSCQQKLFRLDAEYISSIQYDSLIAVKKETLKHLWESKSFLSWNYAEYKAYEKCFK